MVLASPLLFDTQGFQKDYSAAEPSNQFPFQFYFGAALVPLWDFLAHTGI